MRTRPIALIVGLAVIVLLSGCGPVRVEEAGAEVGIDPCTLLSPADVEEVMGRPASSRMGFSLQSYPSSQEGVGGSRSCHFRIPPDTGFPHMAAEFNYVQIAIADRAWSESEVRAAFDAAEEEDPATPIEGLGRLAATYSGEHEYRYIEALGEHGVFLGITVEDDQQPEPSLVLDRATRLLRRALERAETSFPGDQSALPAPPPAPVDPCSLIDPKDAAAAFSIPPTVKPYVHVHADGPGPLGNSWSCGGHFDGAGSLRVELFERAASAEQMAAAGGHQIKEFPGVAFAWRTTGAVPSRAAVVVVANGRSITTSAEQEGASTDLLLRLATQQAQKAAARLARAAG